MFFVIPFSLQYLLGNLFHFLDEGQDIERWSSCLWNNILYETKTVNIFTYSLWIKPTDALNSSFIGITTLHVSGSLSTHRQEFLAVNRLWYILCSCDEPFATRSRMELSSIGFGTFYAIVINRLLPGVGWNSVPSALVHFMQLWWTVCYQE